MSVQKLQSDSRLVKEKTPYTLICNKVIQNIKNGDAFLVWSYLQSKSGNWKVIKQNIKNVYGFGDAKLKKIFSYLNRSNLISYVQRKGSKGQFEPMDILVQNGINFDKNQSFIQSEPVGQKPDRAVTLSSSNDELLNKETTKERKELKKHIRSSNDEHVTSFNQFWEVYPKKQKKEAAKKIWIKNNLSSKSKEIIDHLYKRLDTEWLGIDRQFIPLADTFLRNNRWEDEILSPVKEKTQPPRQNETRCAVPWFNDNH